MKKILVPILLIALCSCNSATTDGTKNSATSVSTDSSVHPTGVNEGSVISTDTAAYKLNDTGKQKQNSKH